MVLFVKAALDYPAEEVGRIAGRLLSVQGKCPADPAAADLVDIDIQIKGWPWADGNFSWAEPTAWASLALRRSGFGSHERVEEGLRLLLDRATDQGGINYGNRRVLGRLTEPLLEPTAFMLLACQGRERHPRIAAAVNYVRKEALGSEDLERLCWARLALDLYRDIPEVATALPELAEKIKHAHQARTKITWLKPAPVREALTALALGADRQNCFSLADLGALTQRRSPMADLGALTRTRSPASKQRPWPERIRSVLRGFLIEGAGKLRPALPKTNVHIARVQDYNADLDDVLLRQYEAFRSQVPLSGKRVVLKPNLVEYHRDKVINTNPLVVGAAIELCKREGASEVIVAEGPGHCRNVEYLVQASGLGDVLKHYRVPFVDLNHDEPVKTLNLGRLTGLEYLYLSRTVVQADVLISLPKLKTHHWAGATLSLKNLFGTLPGVCYGWPKNELHWRGIDNSIVDIALTRTPDLAIVDGVVGMEGDGPLNGTPKPMGAVIMGTDLVAVDATCCRLMELNPERIGYLVMGHRKRLGLLNSPTIQQVGERIEDMAQPFETVPHFEVLHQRRSAG
jgi:uncharacterized protein (DUF362 family)